MWLSNNNDIYFFKRISLSQIKKWLPNANLKINPTTELMKIFSVSLFNFCF